MNAELLLAKLNQLDVKKTILVSLGAAAFYYLLIFDDGSSIDRQIKQVKTRVIEQEGIRQKTEQLLRNKEEIQGEVAILGEKFEGALKKLPNELNVPQLISVITRVAQSTGAKILGIRPSKNEQKSIYEELVIGISLEGKFSSLALFISQISQLERIIKVRSVSFKRGESGGKPKSVLTMEGDLVSFRYTKQEEAKPSDG